MPSRQHEDLRNVKVGERSLERNNSVFSRKELIKKEYNKIMDQRLPNILSLMNHDKYNISAGAGLDGGGNSIQEEMSSGNLGEYDETELLSKMFSKDRNNLSLQQQL